MKPITNEEILEGLNELGSAMNDNMEIIFHRFKIIMEVMEHYSPGAEDMYKKKMFQQQCYQDFITLHNLRNGNNPNALEMIKEQLEQLEALKKLGKDSGWQSAYNKASRNAEHFIQESEKKEPPKLEIVKP